MTSFAQKMVRLADLFGGDQNGYGIPLSNRNLVVDGNKDVWNASSNPLNTTGTYLANVVYAGKAGAGGAGTYTQAAWSASPGAPTRWGLSKPVGYFGITNITTASTGNYAARTTPAIWSPIESVVAMEGSSFTLSVWLWLASGSTPVTITNVFADQNFGVGGSPSAVVLNSVAVNWVVTPTPQRFSVRIDVPGIAGKTLGTTNDGYTQVGVQFPPGLTYQIADCQWQLEQSSPQAPASGLPTAFEYRGVQAELARVQRYWQSVIVSTAIPTSASNSGNLLAFSSLPVVMRAAPAISLVADNYWFAATGVTGSAAYISTASAVAAYKASLGVAGTAEFSQLLAADARL